MVNRIGDDVMDKDVLQFMISQIEKIGTQQEAILVKTAELAVEQKHLSNSVDEIKDDVSGIQDVQNQHTNDIKEIKEKLLESQSFREFAIEFAKNHPIICLVLILMVVNIVLVSLGLPLINIHAIWTTLVAGGA